jgi:ferrochelatase
MPTPDTALLLVNLGTPEAPTARAVRRYLSEFLHDRRVVSLTRWLWCPLLHFVILPLRGPKVAHKYAEIWLPGGSPLAVYTRQLAEAAQALAKVQAPTLRVDWAMRYGAPSVAGALAALAGAGVRRVHVLPLYPQYSTTTTASVEDAVAAAVRAGQAPPEVRVLGAYHAHPQWITAVAASIRAHWQAHGRGEQLLFSFHGIPQRLVDAGDPYAAQCEASVAATARVLDLAPGEYRLTYQSRFGREPWLSPATDQTLRALAAAGSKRVDVVCPGFAVDGLETLEEIALQNAAWFRAAGGEALGYIPCLNAAPEHAALMLALAREADAAACTADAAA